ncbi:MAG: sulfatase [Deltaproteobacteria bacterium]|nr:sulfatase [Deltaproteobacteria bacterium]
MLAIAVLTAWAPPSAAAPTALAKPNIVVISLDTVRADHLGIYGYRRRTSPNITRLALRSSVFDRAYSATPWTLGSFAALWTSQLPSVAGIFDWGNHLKPPAVTLAEILRSAGYETHAVVSCDGLQRNGIEQGFDVFDDSLNDRLDAYAALTSRDVTDAGIRALNRERRRPIFLWLHYFDPHEKYLDHPEFAFGSAEIDLYDEEIASTDFHIGLLIDFMLEKGLFRNTIIVLHADHGEEFGEHGGSRHAMTLYEEVVRVPLIIYVPERAPDRVKGLVSLVDVAPTLLSLAGVEIPSSFRGRTMSGARRTFRSAEKRYGLSGKLRERPLSPRLGRRAVQADLRLRGQGRCPIRHRIRPW